jgi:hypothetical protein
MKFVQTGWEVTAIRLSTLAVPAVCVALRYLTFTNQIWSACRLFKYASPESILERGTSKVKEETTSHTSYHTCSEQHSTDKHKVTECEVLKQSVLYEFVFLTSILWEDADILGIGIQTAVAELTCYHSCSADIQVYVIGPKSWVQLSSHIRSPVG